jgi:branched-chain amino acid aminotransferase
MAFKADKIWLDGKFVDWDKAQIHVLSHVVHYGTSAFEGLRCYNSKNGPVVLRMADHIKRLFESAKIYRFEMHFTQKEIADAIIETLKINQLDDAYIRPFIFRGFGALGVDPSKCPVSTSIAAWNWGKYLGADSMEKGVSVRISSWRRPAPDTLPAMAKVGANYMNSQLIKMEALQDGFDEGLALDYFGYVSEGSGENIFIVRDNVIFTPPSSSSILPGITRHCVFQMARDLGYEIKQQVLPREVLYTADEVFMSGTAAEITPVRAVDNLPVADGKRGPITKALQETYFAIINGEREDKFNWLTPVK